MYYSISIAPVNEGAVEKVLDTAREIVPKALQEKGCLMYHVFISDKDPNTVVMLEQWESAEDFAAHTKGPCCAAFGAVLDANCGPCILQTGYTIEI